MPEYKTSDVEITSTMLGIEDHGILTYVYSIGLEQGY